MLILMFLIISIFIAFYCLVKLFQDYEFGMGIFSFIVIVILGFFLSAIPYSIGEECFLTEVRTISRTQSIVSANLDKGIEGRFAFFGGYINNTNCYLVYETRGEGIYKLESYNTNNSYIRLSDNESPNVTIYHKEYRKHWLFRLGDEDNKFVYDKSIITVPKNALMMQYNVNAGR